MDGWVVTWERGHFGTLEGGHFDGHAVRRVGTSAFRRAGISSPEDEHVGTPVRGWVPTE